MIWPIMSFGCSSFRGLVNLYYDVLPKLGSIFARNKDAYEYLIESIKLFIQLNENQFVLDLACGSGDISELLSKLSLKYSKALILKI